MSIAENVKIDESRQIITIYGIDYHVSLFKTFGLSKTDNDKWLKIIESYNGTLTVAISTEDHICENHHK